MPRTLHTIGFDKVYERGDGAYLYRTAPKSPRRPGPPAVPIPSSHPARAARLACVLRVRAPAAPGRRRVLARPPRGSAGDHVVTWVGGQWQPVSQVKGAKLGANVTSRRATSGHRQPLSVQVSHHRATPTAFPRRTKCAYAAAGQRLALSRALTSARRAAGLLRSRWLYPSPGCHWQRRGGRPATRGPGPRPRRRR
jgi:hypothetical protein